MRSSARKVRWSGTIPALNVPGYCFSYKEVTSHISAEPETSRAIASPTKKSPAISRLDQALPRYHDSSTWKVTDTATRQDKCGVAFDAADVEEWKYALENDDTIAVSRLFEQGLDFESPVLEGIPPLCHAARQSVAITRYLLEAGIDVDGEAGSAGTPLQNAIHFNKDALEVTKLLLEYGADVNAPAGPHGTALNAAVTRQETSIIHLLIQRGADLDQLDSSYRAKTLLVAIEEDDVSLAIFLLDAGTDPNTDVGDGLNIPLLCSAVLRPNKEMVHLLLDRGADPNPKRPLSPLELASDPTIMRALLDHGANITVGNDELHPALLDAISAGHEEKVLLFLEYGQEAPKVFEYCNNNNKKLPPGIEVWGKAAERYVYHSLTEIAGAFIKYRGSAHLSSHRLRSENMPVEMKWDWEVPAMIEMARSSGVAAPDITHWLLNENVVLIADSGSASAKATNCGDILLQHLGKAEFDFVVELLNETVARNLDVDDHGSSVSSRTFIPATNWSDDSNRSRVLITASYRTVIVINPSFPEDQYCNALDWLCRTVHMPGSDGSMILSEAIYTFDRCEVTTGFDGRPVSKRRHVPRYEILPSMHLMSSPLPADEHDCWRLLLNSCVVSVYKKPSEGPPGQDIGKGLEMAFDLMVSLAAVECQLIIDGGVLFVGYQTVLFPTAISISQNCAQFHVIVSDGGQINPYTLEMPERMLADDTSRFKDMRCFLGWCEAAQINLGTKQLPANVRYSGGRDQEKYLALDGQSTQLQIGTQSPVSCLAGLQTNFRFMSSRRQFAPADCYVKLLQDTAEELAIVYDAGHRRCWLLPKLSLLLHMSHAYAQRRALPGDRVPHVDPHADARDIIEIMKAFCECPIHEDPTNPFLFRQLLLGLNINLLVTVSALRQSSGKKLYGFEFLDVVTSPGRGSCMKKLDLVSAGKAWLDIVNVVDAVVVCSELGEAITPVEDNGRKSPCCNAVPKNQDYLAATLPCLNRLIERKGGMLTPQDGFQGVKISEDSYWHLCGDPFRPCLHGTSDTSSCWKRFDIIQHLEPAKKFKLLPVAPHIPSSPPVNKIPLSGAVVFGKCVA